MSRTAVRPLDPEAVSAADDQFYANHPELVDANGERIPLSATDPSQAGLRSEWMDLYEANGGEMEEPDEDEDEAPPGPVEECPLQEEEEPTATIEARWSKSAVLPVHNSARPPASPPTDAIPEDAKVAMLVDTTEVPDGTPAEIRVLRCRNDAEVNQAAFDALEVQGDRVVDPESGEPPEWSVQASHQPWDPWDVPYFYFRVQVDHQGLEAETPSDCEAETDACLRVTYWHVCLAETGDLTGVLPECNTINGILNGVDHSESSVENYGGMNTALNVYGSHIRNTYVFHQASHGNARHRTTNAPISSVTASQPPDDVPDPENWRSVVSFTPMPRFGDAEIGTADAVPSTPRYLYYASTCLTGWESSFADALMARGTRHVLAFRRTIPDAEAPVFAREFYTKWADDYALDPEKVPDCFFQYASDHYDNMRPILYGPGGGRARGSGLSSTQIALIAVGAVVAGVLIGAAIYAALK